MLDEDAFTELELCEIGKELLLGVVTELLDLMLEDEMPSDDEDMFPR